MSDLPVDTVAVTMVGDPARMSLSNNGQIEVMKSADGQLIVWQLPATGDATFQPLKGPDPGFMWVGGDPGDTFVGPTLDVTKKVLTLTDMNPLSGSGEGTFPYKLHVLYNGIVHASDGPDTTTSDPAIVNK